MFKKFVLAAAIALSPIVAYGQDCNALTKDSITAIKDNFHVDYAFYPSKGYVINIFKSNKSLDGFYAVVVLRIKIENGEPTEVCILQDGVITPALISSIESLKKKAPPLTDMPSGD